MDENNEFMFIFLKIRKTGVVTDWDINIPKKVLEISLHQKVSLLCGTSIIFIITQEFQRL